ncbi:hypothetical protein [Nonomuraea sp. NPDC050643]|uniref:hypothetical protein n=1 Tax=Nonomuraea sp. NPDC050643 TaxID=3155660 RepID=UPI0033F55510
MTGTPQEPNDSTSARPRELRLAFVLFLVSALPTALALVPSYQSALTGLYLLLYLWFGIRATRGRQGSRIGVTIVTAVAWLLLAPVFLDAFSGTTDELYGLEYAILGLLGLAAGTYAVALLYGRNGNAYFVSR